MSVSTYEQFCETLWQSWLQNSLELTSPAYKQFQLEYVPEPYLRFSEAENPLYVLTTNPGGGLPLQHRQKIVSGVSPLSAVLRYVEAARVLAD